MRLWKTTVLSFTQTQDLGRQTGSALQRLGNSEEFPSPAGGCGGGVSELKPRVSCEQPSSRPALRRSGAGAASSPRGLGAKGAGTAAPAFRTATAPGLRQEENFELGTFLVNGIISLALALDYELKPCTVFPPPNLPRCWREPSRAPERRAEAAEASRGGRRPQGRSSRSPRPAARESAPGRWMALGAHAACNRSTSLRSSSPGCCGTTT